MGRRLALVEAVQEIAMPRIGKDEQKQLIKEAIKEWCDEQFALFGKWSLRAIAAAALGAIGYFILTTQGWHR